MPQGELIAAFLFGAFVLFITARGDLGAYIRMLV